MLTTCLSAVAATWLLPPSICYTADGECVLAGGRTKYVCIYAVEKQLLLKRFQLSHNRSIDGTVDKLNTKNLTEAGDINELDMSGSDDEKTCVHRACLPWLRCSPCPPRLLKC